MKLVCTQCGADGEMKCECGVAFVALANATPKAEQVALALVDPANAVKSARVIAKELGVGAETVNRVRKSTASNGAVAPKRVGKDGKARKPPTKPNPVPVQNFTQLDIGTERIKGQPVQLMPAPLQRMRDSSWRVSEIAMRVNQLGKADVELFESDVSQMLTHVRGKHPHDNDYARKGREALDLIDNNIDAALAVLTRLRDLARKREAAE